MKIIISPAKRISAQNDFTFLNTLPKHQDRAVHLYEILKKLTKDELKAVYKASDAIVTKSYDDLHNFDINKGFLHALLAYDGIQYQAMAPSVLDEDALTYLNEHLRILSGLYGALSPFDLIIPYAIYVTEPLHAIFLRNGILMNINLLRRRLCNIARHITAHCRKDPYRIFPSNIIHHTSEEYDLACSEQIAEIVVIPGFLAFVI